MSLKVINKLGEDARGRQQCAAIEDKVLKVNNVTNGNQRIVRVTKWR